MTTRLLHTRVSWISFNNCLNCPFLKGKSIQYQNLRLTRWKYEFMLFCTKYVSIQILYFMCLLFLQLLSIVLVIVRFSTWIKGTQKFWLNLIAGWRKEKGFGVCLQWLYNANISIHILQTSKVLTRRISLAIKSFLCW